MIWFGDVQIIMWRKRCSIVGGKTLCPLLVFVFSWEIMSEEDLTKLLVRVDIPDLKTQVSGRI